ncbi:MAG: replication-associated recombination protein A [Polyangiaceae bacterium]|nr:replication-associated recombination protein A [Polyangiaceae bacterium]
MRPRTLGDLLGQEKFLKATTLFRTGKKTAQVPSMLLWGPPGVGKTTIAKILADHVDANFVSFSAVLGNLAELRAILETAQEDLLYRGRRTLLFMDEIHRFNKAQQDAFLPHVEQGRIILVGATTENPSFAINPALLSRCKSFRLEPLSALAIRGVIERALVDREKGLGTLELTATDELLEALSASASGDARRALTLLEYLSIEATARGIKELSLELYREIEAHASIRHDRKGDSHYDLTSALIKSMRGSDPDAALYWLTRLLEGGEDPLFVLRRLIIFASEDIGLADSRALTVVMSADEAFRRIGMPEGMFPLAHATTYLAVAPKSNATYVAWKAAQETVQKLGALEIPFKLRNAPTALMKREGFGAEYKYPHDHGGWVLGEHYLPDELRGRVFYEPTERGEEAKIKGRLEVLRSAQRGKAEPESK